MADPQLAVHLYCNRTIVIISIIVIIIIAVIALSLYFCVAFRRIVVVFCRIY